MSILHGFDVSAYQGNIVPAADFVIVKATEGSVYSSSRFAAQWASAKTRARVRGAYHFARPEESSGSSQADRLINAAKAVPGELLVLDLEASQLTQAQTNAWARAFGDRLRERAPGVTTVLYMGSAYATNGTGRGLADHFDLWWYPQYPSSAAATKWPSSVSPWLPGGLTCGWERPHIWQWTSSFNGLDADITDLTLEQLAGGGQPTPQEDDMAQVSSLGVDGKQTVAASTHADVIFTKEYTDKQKLHGENGVSVVIADGSYWVNADALFCLEGLAPGAKIDVAWTRVDDSGKFLDDAWRKTFTADEHGLVADELGGQFSVSKDNRLRLRVYNTSDRPVTVVAEILGRPVTMAKATLLKY